MKKISKFYSHYSHYYYRCTFSSGFIRMMNKRVMMCLGGIPVGELDSKKSFKCFFKRVMPSFYDLELELMLRDIAIIIYKGN